MGAAIPRTCREDSATSPMLIKGSLQFNESVETYMTRTPSSDGNRRTFTVSCWYRKTVTDGSTQVIMFAGPDGDDTYSPSITPDNQIQAGHYQGGWQMRVVGPEMRDYSSWNHIVTAWDTTQGNANDRIKIYMNGVQITDFSTASMPTQNYDTSINKVSTQQRIGFQVTANAFELDGYLTEFNFIDGQQLDASYFGYNDPLTGTWRPKKFDISSTPGGSWGTCGFYLPMDGSGATVGTDQSGQGNDWTLTNLSSANVCAQSPSGIVYSGKQRHGGSTTYNASRLPANYCTLDRNNMGGALTLKDAATEVESTGPANVMGTHVIPPNSGKYYWECKVLNTMAGVIGISDASVAAKTALSGVASIRGYGADGKKYYGDTGASYGSVFSHSGWVGVLFDSDVRTLEFYYNGVSQGIAFTAGANGIVDGAYYAPCFHLNGMELDKVNFGANYAYSTTAWSTVPPEGYKTLCDASLSQSTGIVLPEQYVKPVIWTGNETAGRQIEVGFNPDLIIGRARNDSQNWYWTDTVRGSNKFLYSNSEGDEVTTANIINVDDNNVKGFKVGSSGVINGTSSYNYVGYAFKAGGSKNTFNVDDVGYASASAAGLAAGDITVTGASVGTKQGFSIIGYQSKDGGGGFSHGLSETPEILVIKGRAGSTVYDNWGVYYTVNGVNTNWNELQSTNAQGSNSSSQTPGGGPSGVFAHFTSTQCYISSNSYANASNDPGQDMIAYVWHSVPGFSKFGTYTGNQAADGPFSNLGFKPAIVIIKNLTNDSTPWFIFDSARDPDNPIRLNLNPNDNAAEEDDTNGTWDWAANGMKMTSSGTHPNKSDSKIMYWAWAESPFANLYGGQSNAKII